MSTRTIVAHWGLPEEELFAASCDAISINFKPSKLLPQTLLDLATPQTRVVVCGTYAESLDALLELCECTVLVYSPEDVAAQKYGPQCTYRLLRDAIPVAQYPWMRHIVRRTQPDAKEEDEAFYRGLIHALDDKPIYGAFVDFCRGGCDSARLIATGAIIVEHITRLAAFQAKAAAVRMQAGGREALVLSSAWSPVLPIAKELAAGGALGVVVRYNFATQHTHFTFCGEDLEFVRAPPFNGGGDAQVSGATITGIVPIVRIFSLEECVERFAQ
jgi:hypothetical protein